MQKYVIINISIIIRISEWGYDTNNNKQEELLWGAMN